MAVDQEVAFPTLAPHDLAALAGRGRERHVRTGEVLYSVGDTTARFFVVLEGEIEAIDGDDPSAARVATIGPGQFTGEVATLSGRAALVTCVRRATAG